MSTTKATIGTLSRSVAIAVISYGTGKGWWDAGLAALLVPIGAWGVAVARQNARIKKLLDQPVEDNEGDNE